jgi:hypothetical protein
MVTGCLCTALAPMQHFISGTLSAHAPMLISQLLVLVPEFSLSSASHNCPSLHPATGYTVYQGAHFSKSPLVRPQKIPRYTYPGM